jgi:hypothetical protein
MTALNRPARTAILHLGTEKTGTTTIQNGLVLNRAALAERGWEYPEGFGNKGSIHLALHAMDVGRYEDLHARLGLDSEEKRRAFRAEVKARFLRDMAALPPTVHTVILSSEYFHSRVRGEDEIRAMRDLLAATFDRVRMVVYLRRQDELAVSSYSTRMRSGRTEPEVLPEVGADDSYYNYELLLAQWSAAFPEAEIVPRVYRRDEWVDGNLVHDFLAACGVDDRQGLQLPERWNESISAPAQEFLRQMNLHFPTDGRKDRHRDELVSLVAGAFAGPGKLPSREAAERFYRLFEPSNERLRRRWLPQRPRLFDDDFSQDPTQATEPPSFEDAAAIAAVLLRKLQAETAYREGRLAEAKRRPERAVEEYRAAVALDPTHATARQRLLRLTGGGSRPTGLQRLLLSLRG